MKIIDAADQVLGRVCSIAAKSLMEGDEVSVINAEKAVLTGDPEMILKHFWELRDRGDPHHGPYYPKNPDMILKRSIRGMLPYKKEKGREALKKLKVYNGNPLNKPGENSQKNVSELKCKFLTLDQISKRLRGVG